MYRASDIIELWLPDYAHPLYLRGDQTDYKVFEDVFVKETYRYDKELQPELIVDAGANVGYASVYFANRFPNSKIIAIEPEEKNFSLLKRNAKLYPLIEPVQSAISNVTRPFRIANTGAGAWAYRIEELEPDSKTTNSPYTVTLNQLLSASEEATITFIKIDIEGAERQLFASNTEWLDRVAIVMIELHDRIVPGCSDAVWNAIKDRDFLVTKSHDIYILTNQDFFPSPD